MVKIWFVREGPEPTKGGPAYRLPLDTCIDKLGLMANQFLSGPEKTPRFGHQTVRLTGISDYRHVVCEIKTGEESVGGFKPGFYRIEFSPREVVALLGPPDDPWKPA